jgi:hypothetical protein
MAILLKLGLHKKYGINWLAGYLPMLDLYIGHCMVSILNVNNGILRTYSIGFELVILVRY